MGAATFQVPDITSSCTRCGYRRKKALCCKDHRRWGKEIDSPETLLSLHPFLSSDKDILMSPLFRRNITCYVRFRANIFPEKINCCLAQTHHGHIMAASLQHRLVWSGYFCLPKSASQLARIISFMDPERNAYVQSIFPTQRGMMSYS